MANLFNALFAPGPKRRMMDLELEAAERKNLLEKQALERAEAQAVRREGDMEEIGNRLSGAPRTIQGSMFNPRPAMSDAQLVNRNRSDEELLAEFSPAPFSGVVPNDSRVVQRGKVVLDAAPERPKASTDLAQLKSDRDSGFITDDEYKAEVARMTAGPQNEETFSNPVPEVGPDGKLIQVRYGSKGGRQVVPNATPAKQGNAFDRPDYWRAQFKPYLDTAQNATTQSRKVKTSLALGTGIGDIAAINALQKQIDEGAVVRDQDVALVQGAQSLIGRFFAADGSIKKGTKLTPQLRAEMQAASDALTKAIQDGVQSRIVPYIQTMKGEDVSLENIVPEEVQKFYGWSAPTGGWSIKKVN